MSVGRSLTRTVIYALIFIVLSFFYTGFALHYEANSDAASMFLQAIDMARGNVLLKGWELSTVSFYFTETLPHAIAVLLFGESNLLLYVVPAMLYSALIIVLFQLMRQKGSLASSCIGLAYIAIPSLGMIAILLTGAIHVGAYLLIAIAFLALGRIETQFRKEAFVTIFVTLTLAMFSDGITLYIGVAPTLLSASFMAWHKRSKGYALVAGICIVSLIAAKALMLLFDALDGFKVPGDPAAMFVQVRDIDNNLVLFFEGLLYMFDANFFGKPLAALGTVRHVIHFLGLSLFFVLIWKIVKKQVVDKDFDAVDVALVTACAISSVSYVISTMPMDIGTTRYLVPLFLFGSAVIGRNIVVRSDRNVVMVFIASLVYAVTLFPGLTYSYPQQTISSLASVLSSHGLTQGYGTYWNASSITVASNGGVNVRPIFETEFSRSRWLSKGSWYSEEANFIVIDSENSILKSLAIDTLGAPEELIEHDEMIIMVWDYNITPRLD